MNTLTQLLNTHFIYMYMYMMYPVEMADICVRIV